MLYLQYDLYNQHFPCYHKQVTKYMNNMIICAVTPLHSITSKTVRLKKECAWV